MLRAGSVLIVDTSAVARKFYAAANSILLVKMICQGYTYLNRIVYLCLPMLLLP